MAGQSHSSTSLSLPVKGRTSFKAPSFKGLKPSGEASSRAMQGNRKRDTKPELLLRHALWKLGLRYRKHVRSVPGQPDVVFGRHKVAVFCDGDFWHGRNWFVLRRGLERRANASYWIAKIARNMKRDIAHMATLRAAGWHIVRFWETDIRQDPLRAALKVRKVIESQHRNTNRIKR